MDNMLFMGEEAGLPPPIPQQAQEELVKKLKDEYRTFQNNVKPLHKKIERWHKLYEAVPKGEKTFPWPGASNYTIPLIMSVVDSVHARLVKAVFDVDPIWLAKARTPDGVGVAKKAEWYLDYWSDQMRLPTQMDMAFQNMLMDGTGVVRTDWVRKTRTIRAQNAPPETIVEYEGPEVVPIPLLDFVLIPASSPTINDAVYVGHRVWRTAQQLEERRDAQVYFNVDVLLEKSQGDNESERKQHPSGLINTMNAGNLSKETQPFEIVEMFGHYDFGDGEYTPVLMAFSPQHDILLRLEPTPYNYERPPYVDFKIYPRANFFWGRSIPELLESFQEEITALHNMRSDAISRRIAPPILRSVGSAWNPKDQKWAPGQVLDVNEPGEISELSMADIPGSIFAHENDLMAFVERVTGMSDYSMGRSPSLGRTATEVNRVTSEGLVRLDVGISRIQHGGMSQLAWQIWWLLYQYRPVMDFFYAENIAMAITKQEMRAPAGGLMPFEFVAQGQLSDASKEARRAQLLMLMNVVSGPLQQFFPDGLQYLLDKILSEHDIQDRANIIGPPWSVIQQQMQQAFQAGAQAAMEQMGGEQ